MNNIKTHVINIDRYLSAVYIKKLLSIPNTEVPVIIAKKDDYKNDRYLVRSLRGGATEIFHDKKCITFMITDKSGQILAIDSIPDYKIFIDPYKHKFPEIEFNFFDISEASSIWEVKKIFKPFKLKSKREYKDLWKVESKGEGGRYITRTHFARSAFRCTSKRGNSYHEPKIIFTVSLKANSEIIHMGSIDKPST